MKTRLLHFRNDYQKTCYAKIIELNKEDQSIVLDQTVFYPRGGNQDTDTGIIRQDPYILSIESVKKDRDTGVIKHYLTPDSATALDMFHTGQSVFCEINWEKRYQLMKTHTAQHLLSYVLESQFGLKTLKLDLLIDYGYIELDGTFSFETLLSAQHIAQRYIKQGLAIKRKSSNGKFHVIIGNIDDRECGGTHVRRLSEIGCLNIYKVEEQRVYFAVARNAEDIREDQQLDSLKLQSMIPPQVKHVDKFKQWVENMQAELSYLRTRTQELAEGNFCHSLYASHEFSGIERDNETYHLSFHNIPTIDVKRVKKILKDEKGRPPQTSICLCKNRTVAVISTNPFPAFEIMHILKAQDPQMRGGGSKTFAQGGPFLASFEQLKEWVLREWTV